MLQNYYRLLPLSVSPQRSMGGGGEMPKIWVFTGFDPRLGLRNRFLKIELDERTSVIHISKLPHFKNTVKLAEVGVAKLGSTAISDASKSLVDY